MVEGRSARPGHPRTRDEDGPARPYVQVAIAGHAGVGRLPLRAGVAGHSRAAGRGVGDRGRSPPGAVSDHSGGSDLEPRASAARSAARTCTVTGLPNSSEFGTTTRSPESVCKSVTRSFTSVTVPEPTPSKEMRSPILKLRSKST